MDSNTSSNNNDTISKKKVIPSVNQISREDSLPVPLAAFLNGSETLNQKNVPTTISFPNVSGRGQSQSKDDDSLPAPLDNFMENLENSNSKVNDMSVNVNNLQSLGAMIRAPSFGGPYDIQPAAEENRPDFARQGSDSQYAKEDSSMSSSKPSNSGNLYMSGGSNADYVLDSQVAPGFAYERQKNVESQVSSKASELLSSNPPSIFLRAPSKIEVKTNAPNLDDSTSKQIGPSPLGRKSPYTFDHSENPSPFMNVNSSMKPMLAANGNTKINANKFFDSSSPISQAPLMSHASPPIIKEDLRARGGIYNLPPKFETLQDSQNVVEIYDLCKEFDLLGRTEKVKALSSVNMHDESEYYAIKKGEFVMIRGPSGGGKTTFLNLIGTADIASAGRLVIMGSQITEKSNDEYLSKLRLEKIGFVFQTFNLLATMSAYENVELPMKLLGRLSNKAIKQRTIELLTKVGLQDRMDHLPSELSGGEQQRVAIARALANTPEILLLDEPTGDLDTRSTVEVMNLLLSINNFGYTSDQKKCTMIMVTHNPDLECYADRVIYFRDGKLVKQVINEVQTPLELESYLKFLNANNNE